MTDSIDDCFADLVRHAAPADRDAIFRLGVLERRERDLFRRRSLMMLGLALAAIGSVVVVLLLKPTRGDVAGALLVGLFASTAALPHAPALLRRLRLSRP